MSFLSEPLLFLHLFLFFLNRVCLSMDKKFLVTCPENFHAIFVWLANTIHLPRKGTSCSSTVTFSPGMKNFPRFLCHWSQNSLIGQNWSLAFLPVLVFLSSNLMKVSKSLKRLCENAALASELPSARLNKVSR